MNRKLVEKAVEKTERFIEIYLKKDKAESFLSCELADMSKFCDRLSDFDISDENFDYSVTNRRFKCITADRESCVVDGRYSIEPKSDGGYVKAAFRQRCTVVWKIAEGELKIIYLHISGENEQNSLKTAFDDFNQKEHLYRELKKYIEGEEIIKINVRDGVLRYFKKYEIEYVEAMGHDVVIHIDNGEEIICRTTFKRFLELMGEQLIQIHRSYAVRRSTIKAIKKDKIIMSSEQEIPISKKYYTLLSKSG